VSRRTEVAAFGGLALVAVLLWALVPTYPNYDAYAALNWGRELFHGITPTFETYAAPTEHPLYIVIAGLFATVFGPDGDRALVLFTVLSFVALVWAVFRLGWRCFGGWAGATGAVFVGSSFALLLFAAKAYVDVPFLALVLWAAVVEAERPARRGSTDVDPARPGTSGRLVMGMLLVAGLLRPEAWVVAGLYWLWCGWRRWDLLLLAAVAPLAWCAVDALVTGDPLFSLHSTSKLADDLGRERGIVHVPGAFVSFLSSTARPPVAGAGVIGMVLAWRWSGSGRVRALHVPFGLFAAGSLTFVLTGLAGLSIIPRYLTVPVIALCLFGGFAAFGWTRLPPGARGRRLWGQLVVAGAVLGLVFVVARVSVVDRLFTELRYIRSTHDTLAALLHDPRVQAGRACGGVGGDVVTLPNYRLVPDTQWLLQADADQVGARSDRRRPYGVAIFTADHKTLTRFGYAAGATRTTNTPDPGFREVARNAQFAAYVRCP
jgi:hypothetical protein